MGQTPRQLSKTLQEAGIRVTPQRVAVFGVLRDSREHLSAEDVYQRVRQRQPGLSLATVYRTLEMLRDAGLALEGRLGEGRNFYEANVEPHFHFVCLACHAVEDLAPERAVELQRELAEESGHTVRWSRLDLFGTCASCGGGTPTVA
jgi:Fur family peroxide stress response transcriptional regulator